MRFPPPAKAGGFQRIILMKFMTVSPKAQSSDRSRRERCRWSSGWVLRHLKTSLPSNPPRIMPSMWIYRFKEILLSFFGMKNNTLMRWMKSPKKGRETERMCYNN